MSAILALKLLAAGERQQRLMRVRTPHESRSPSQSPLSFLCLVQEILFPLPAPKGKRSIQDLRGGKRQRTLFYHETHLPCASPCANGQQCSLVMNVRVQKMTLPKLIPVPVSALSLSLQEKKSTIREIPKELEAFRWRVFPSEKRALNVRSHLHEEKNLLFLSHAAT